MSTLTFYLDKIKLSHMLKSVERVPQKVVTKAAGKGANVVRKAIKVDAPVMTGDLKRGIVRTGERSKVRGKKVYQVTFSSSMNDVFQKPIQNPGVAGGSSEKGYYPASMEYGFLTRSKGGGLSYVPGYHFMANAASSSERGTEQAMVTTLIQELEKEWTQS